MKEKVFEPGQFWRTRNGRKALIYNIVNQGGHIHGAVYWGNDSWEIIKWYANGSFSMDMSINDLDLVERWIEKKKIKIKAWRCIRETPDFTIGLILTFEEGMKLEGHSLPHISGVISPDPEVWERCPWLDGEVEREVEESCQ